MKKLFIEGIRMKKNITKISMLAVCISILAVSAFAGNAKEVPSFSDGSTLSCFVSSNIGNDGNGYTEKRMDVFYRIDQGQREAHAYFRKVEKIGNYSFDGSCGTDVCGLGIRDLRTNTVSMMNASYSKLNNNTAQIEVMNFKENLTLTMWCTLKK